MDTKNSFDNPTEEALKHINPKTLPQMNLPEKSSPSQKKNNPNNIQMSYYFPSGNNIDNSEKDSEYTTGINSLQDSFSKMNIKSNQEGGLPMNFSLKNEQEKFMFYNNQSQGQYQAQPTGYPNQAPKFQGNFNQNQNTPNIAYFNNYSQQGGQGQNVFPKGGNNRQREDYGMNVKMNYGNQNMGQFNQGQGYYNNANEEEFQDNNPQKEKRIYKKNIEQSGNPLSYSLQNKGGYSQIARFFVIKSVDEDNIHKSIKFRIWCSTFKGNQKLQKAFKEAENAYPIYLFFSVNGSGRFLGLAQMTSEVDYHANFNYWSQGDKWKGFFFVVWLIIKDVPNKAFRHIINEYNEGKPITSSRDTQEIHPAAGMEALKIFKEYPLESSILDDFQYYEKKQIGYQQGMPPQQQMIQQQQQQQFYNNMGGSPSNIGQMPNMKNTQNFGQFNMQQPQQGGDPNEEFYQKMGNFKDITSNNNTITSTNFPNKNPNFPKKEMPEMNFQQSNFMNN